MPFDSIREAGINIFLLLLQPAGIDYIQRYKKREGKGLEELTCVKQLRPTEESLPPPPSYLLYPPLQKQAAGFFVGTSVTNPLLGAFFFVITLYKVRKA